MAKNSRRSTDPRFFLLSTIPSDDDKTITGSRLPTARQVLLCFLAHNQTASSKRDAANKTVKIVIPFYNRARIPTILPHKMAEEVEKLFDDMKKILKIQPKDRDSGKPKDRVESFKSHLKTTMKFWPRNSLQKLSNEDDKAFLQSMMTDRQATMSGIDSKLSSTEKKVRQRKDKELKRIERSNQIKESDIGASCSTTTTMSDSDDEDDDDNIPETVHTCAKRSHKRCVKTGVSVFIPPNILQSPRVVQSLVRNNISSAAISSVMHNIVTAVEGDPSKLNLSYATSQRYRVETVTTIAEKIKENWTPPSVANLHWDGKLMSTLDGAGQEERLPVLLSGVGGTKLLGVPAIPHKSTETAGDLISEVSMKLIEEWNCAECLAGMVFDTTSSNTGSRTAACVALQGRLNRPLLWYACRHHVGEVILTHTWDALKIEVSKSPEILVFKRFKENFSSITHENKADLDFPEIPFDLLGRISEIKALCNAYLKKSFSRGDYKELVTLVLLYLSEGNDIEGFSFSRPGAMHKARWMAKLLYAIKMDLLGTKMINELPKGAVFASHQLQKIRRFVQFVVFCYVPWWLTSPVPSAAPINDQLLINSFINYKLIDGVMATAAIKSFGNHMWYLTEELVPLALFSNSLDANIKQKMVTKMLGLKGDGLCLKRHGNGFGKPTFPEMPTEITEDLSRYVGMDSWSFFKIMKISQEFLYKPVTEWASDEGFESAKLVVNSISVVNDAAERGVKLGHDFLGTAVKEERYQRVLQVVENSRHAEPNTRKRKLYSSSWYLTL